MFNHAVMSVAVAALAIAPLEASIAQTYSAPRKVHYAKTELDKAKDKCALTMVGGTILGGFLGALAGGGKGVLIGAPAGLLVGGVACQAIMQTAKRKDQIIQAQLASANYQSAVYTTTIQRDDGQFAPFEGRAGESRMIDGARLAPVRYKAPGGETIASPVLDTGNRECRPISGSLSAQPLPQQLVCRTPDGNWGPYAQQKA